MCDCVRITYNLTGESSLTTVEVNVTGIYNGQNYYQWMHLGSNYFLFYSTSFQWEVVVGDLDESVPPAIEWKSSTPPCPPLGTIPASNNGWFESFTTEECRIFGQCCIQMEICWNDDREIICNVFFPTKMNDGTYKFEFQLDIFTLFSDGTKWILQDSNGFQWAYIPIEFTDVCPASNNWTILNTEKIASITSTEISCPVDQCDCGISLTYYTNLDGNVTETFENVGEVNGQHAFQSLINGQLVSIWWNSGKWTMSFGDIIIEEVTKVIAEMYQNIVECPATNSEARNSWIIYWTKDDLSIQSSTGIQCGTNTCGIEERIFREYDSIKLPENFEEPNRGLKGCCECEYLVFASGSSSTFENDVTSAWMKLSSSSDVLTFVLEDAHGNQTNFVPTPQPFIKEPNAYYTTINWKDVLNSDGQGCYTLKIAYSISGIVGFVIWGHYKLQNYSIQNTLKTARVRAFFNAFHEMEGINFTDSNVESTFRFYGFIGNRQPNTEIDNIIYQNREMKRVIRENLNQYEIITDPVFECFTRPLIELFLLSENDLFISDYNQHNHSYRIQDIPVILEESASLDYLPLSRYAVLKCKVGDKFKNKRTFF